MRDKPSMVEALKRSRMYVALVTPAWLTDPDTQATLHVAQQLGMPIRCLVAPGTRLPEDFVQGYGDLRVATSQDAAQDTRQVMAWLEEITTASGADAGAKEKRLHRARRNNRFKSPQRRDRLASYPRKWLSSGDS